MVLSISSSNNTDNTVLEIQSVGSFSLDSWSFISNSFTNFSVIIPMSAPQEYFKGVSYRTNRLFFAWDSSANNIAKYNLYHGRQSRNYTNVVAFTDLFGALTNLPAGTNYVSVTVVDNLGLESLFSNEIQAKISYSTPPIPNLVYTLK